MANSSLGAAKKAKKDEFYTMYPDIEREMVAYWNFNKDVFRDKVVLCPADDPEWSNFGKFFADVFEEWGLKKLICTSYAPRSNQDGLFQVDIPEEMQAPHYDPELSETRGRVRVLEREDLNGDGKFDRADMKWVYLEGDGDFRSAEVSALRDEADIVVTNPPFSLFREFMAWLMAGGVQFSVIGNLNAVTYKEMFPLIRDNQVWMGPTISSGDREFRVPESYPLSAAGWRVDGDGTKYIRVKGVRWFTNIEHGKRHEWLDLDPMERNRTKRRAKKEIRERGYPRYDNYDAIEVSYTEAIPSDWEGNMGVPISFLDKYNPEQFEILGITDRGNDYGLKTREYTAMDIPKANDLNRRGAFVDETGALQGTYARILIRHRRPEED